MVQERVGERENKGRINNKYTPYMVMTIHMYLPGST